MLEYQSPPNLHYHLNFSLSTLDQSLPIHKSFSWRQLLVLKLGKEERWKALIQVIGFILPGDQTTKHTNISLALSWIYSVVSSDNLKTDTHKKFSLTTESMVNFPNLHICGLTRKEKGFCQFVFGNGLFPAPILETKS